MYVRIHETMMFSQVTGWGKDHLCISGLDVTETMLQLSKARKETHTTVR